MLVVLCISWYYHRSRLFLFFTFKFRLILASPFSLTIWTGQCLLSQLVVNGGWLWQVSLHVTAC